MHQAGMFAARLQHLGDDSLLANVILGDVFDLDPGLRRQGRRALAHAVAELQGEFRVVEDTDCVGEEKPRHAFGVTNRGKRPRDHDTVVTRQDTGNPLVVALFKLARHRALDSHESPAQGTPSLVPAPPP